MADWQATAGRWHFEFYSAIFLPLLCIQVAPKTVAHIKRCGELGLYNTNHFFRVDRGFVAQVLLGVGARAALNVHC